MIKLPKFAFQSSYIGDVKKIQRRAKFFTDDIFKGRRCLAESIIGIYSEKKPYQGKYIVEACLYFNLKSYWFPVEPPDELGGRL